MFAASIDLHCMQKFSLEALNLAAYIALRHAQKNAEYYQSIVHELTLAVCIASCCIHQILQNA